MAALKFRFILLTILVATACVPTPTPQLPTVTPSVEPPTMTPSPTATATPPQSPPITPTRPPSPVATPTPISLAEKLTAIPVGNRPIIPYQLFNPFFEGDYTHPITTVPEYTVAPGWIPWAAQQPPCLPGFQFPCKAGLTDGIARSPIRVCPDNCQRPDGQCYAAYDCYWQRPEFTAKYVTNYTTPMRVYEGQYSQWYFGRGRQFEAGIYQRVFVGAGSTVTFTIKASAWMCQGSPDCKLGHMNPARQADLMSAWGLVGNYYPYRLWTASDIPGFLRADLPRYNPHDPYTPTMHLKVGIDPTGTFDGSFGGGIYHYPDLGQIVWGKERDYFDVWGTLSVTAVAKSDYVAVVTYARPEWPYAYVNNDIGLDAATLDVRKFIWPYSIDLPLVVNP